ncbi:MAG: hypothetical protein ACSHX5_11865 [Phycisphaerales bacterium]
MPIRSLTASPADQSIPEPSRQGTIISIGTSGMLSACTHKLLERGNRIHLICRNPEQLRAQIPSSLSEKLTSSACDYHDEQAFVHALESAPEPVVAVIGWIHSSAPKAWDAVLENHADADCLKVVGSSNTPIDATPNRTRLVTLGFIIENGSSRWLTHQEISQGVYDAFISGRISSIVGTLEPWSMRP